MAHLPFPQPQRSQLPPDSLLKEPVMTLDTLSPAFHAPTPGAMLRSLREAQNLSQVALAEQCGLDKATISDYERCIHVPSLRSLRKLAEALQVPVSSLIPEDL